MLPNCYQPRLRHVTKVLPNCYQDSRVNVTKLLPGCYQGVTKLLPNRSGRVTSIRQNPLKPVVLQRFRCYQIPPCVLPKSPLRVTKLLPRCAHHQQHSVTKLLPNCYQDSALNVTKLLPKWRRNSKMNPFDSLTSVL